MPGSRRTFGLIGILAAALSGCSKDSSPAAAQCRDGGAIQSQEPAGSSAQDHATSVLDDEGSRQEDVEGAAERDGGQPGESEQTGAADRAAPADAGDDAREASDGSDAGAGSGPSLPEAATDADDVFDPTRVQTYEITVAPEDLASIDANPSAEKMVMASVFVNGETYGPVGLRYKGNGGAFTVPCTANAESGYPGPKVGKCSMKLDFDEYDDNARYHGLKKLNLHSMGHDKSMMRERLGYSLYRDMGVAASRTAYARVVINGQLEGVFLAVEQVDGRFTRDNFKDGGEGNLYKEIWPTSEQPEPYRSALESNKGASTDVDKMVRFAAAIESGGNAASEWLDRDYMLRYIAVDRVIINDDGVFHWYCWPEGRSGSSMAVIANHNYYWYEDTTADRMWLVPWDLDDSFRGDTSLWINVEWSASAACECQMGGGYVLRPATCDPLTAQLAAWRSDYETMVDQLLVGPFSESAVSEKLSAWSMQASALVDEAAGARGAPDRAAWEQALQDFEGVVASARKNRGYPY